MSKPSPWVKRESLWRRTCRALRCETWELAVLVVGGSYVARLVVIAVMGVG